MFDLRYAFRMLIKTPGFSIVAILTLALGIGANTAIFTVVNALLLRPMPYPDADRLVTVWQDLRQRGGPADEWVTPGNYADWRRETGLFEQIAVIAGWRPTLTGQSEPEALAGGQVSHEYFDVLGVKAALGRTFSQADDVPNARRVVMIGNNLWQRRFGASATAIGQVVTLNGEPHEIIGVVPAGFRPVINPAVEIWRPLRLNTTAPARGAVVLRAVARLPEGLTIERAQAAAATLARQLEAAHPEFNEKTGINLIPLRERVVGDIRTGLLALLGAVAFVLLIACANIANLLLARGSVRSRELAVRAALGAARTRVVRQLLTESLVLAALGGIAGVLLGVWAVEALVAAAPASAPRLDEITLDGRVLAFVTALTLLTGVLFGLAPALQASRGGVAAALKDGGRGHAGGGGRALRRGLVAAEIALALVLLTGAGLLLETFVKLQSADLGFDSGNVLVGYVNPPQTNYQTPEQLLAFYDQVLERTAVLPGVERAALASVLPLSGDSDMNFAIEGRPAPKLPSEEPVTWYRLVSASYFDALGMRLVRGHGFETREPSPSVVVNETMARRYFPGEDPIGRRIHFGRPDSPWFTIVGVVADAKMRGARGETRVETFIPYWQYPERGGTNVVLKTAVDPHSLTGGLRKAISSIDPNVAVSNITTLGALVADSIDQPRFFAALAIAFALLALVLAAIGIYGVMAYAVSQRASEIGVRMALGAQPSRVFRLVILDGLRLTSLGIAAGIAGALIVSRWLAALLFGVSPGEPAVFAATAGLLLLVAALACIIPARRATRVDPMVALRAE